MNAIQLSYYNKFVVKQLEEKGGLTQEKQKQKQKKKQKSHKQKRKNVEKKKRNVKEEEIENEFVDEILKKKK